MATLLKERRDKLMPDIKPLGIDIHNFESHLNREIETYSVQSPIVMETSQCVEQIEEF